MLLKTFKVNQFLFLAMLAALTFTGCQTLRIHKSSPTENAVQPYPYESASTFHHVWIKPGVDFYQYTELKISPVNISHLLEMSWWRPGGTVDLAQDTQVLALYAEQTFTEAFRQDETHHFDVVEFTGSKTLILETALIDVTPSRVALNTLGYPILKRPSKEGSAILEARLRDASSGEVLMTLADKEQGDTSILSLKDLTWYGHTEAMINTWAKQLVQVTNQDPDETKTDSAPVDLRVW
ncbi:MAG: hypothetical protein COV74_10525 [Candidatus Omnitrophica bacterium CG11_big_fil_rev_8_21_14_0_20_45_26]|uniref:DUF3313 domain-containing protein n=1 Tax=Candidatus Abzuiibacterium crystallinum TaxID=1974748 RepID=A0A2H0LMX2_9BACT|nr:MAG: hypothetical protein COV74_10525 [Candidatus Omnitrophica bacterium CG11_big_fil_rev_8_21_14_0_20_45_26]PIW63899.1 MAG: hypothetical protein COW12_08290 [Candidatus Omnitrophica bacterium CG12_big_fil_rev_8_21_14_0_65_45_16]